MTARGMATSLGAEGRLAIDLWRKGEGREEGQDEGSCLVRIVASRPSGIVRLLTGRTAEEAPRLVPLIFSVCGMAQGAACVSAIEAALGRPSEAPARAAREVVVLAETAREHVLRIVFDWPRFLGEAVEEGGLGGARVMTAAVRRMSASLFGPAAPFALGARPAPERPGITTLLAEMDDVLERAVFGVGPADWLSWCSASGGAGLQGFEAWAAGGGAAAARLIARIFARGWQGAGAVEPRFLGTLPQQALMARLLAPDGGDFAAAPEWGGAARETGPLARERRSGLVEAIVRRWGAGLLARLAARLVELAGSTSAMRARLAAIDGLSEAAPAPPVIHGGREGGAASLGPGVGMAQAEAARGLLTHAVALRSGRVERYGILAPTEWNFHRRGAAAEALASLGWKRLGWKSLGWKGAPAGAMEEQEFMALAELLVHAIDPCVAFDLRIR